MASIFDALKEIFGVSEPNITAEEIKEAEKDGEKVAEKVEKRLNIEHIEIDHSAVSNTKSEKSRINEEQEK